MRLFSSAKKISVPRIVNQSGQLKIFGYNQYLKTIDIKQALLCYLPHTVLAELRAETTDRFSNAGIGRAWARVLNELGYLVDVVSWDDRSFIPEKNYDLVVFHGG